MLRGVFVLLVIAGVTLFWWLDDRQATPLSNDSAPMVQPSTPSLQAPAQAESATVTDLRGSIGRSIPTAFLDARTLEGSTWGRDGFELECAPGGELRVGGKARARWQIVGNRIRLYDQRGEEHWLDIADGGITWNGEEVGRIR